MISFEPSPAEQTSSDLPAAARPSPWALIFPTPALALLMAIGLVDLVSTAVLHRAGLIVELNPIMRVFITRSEWLFAFAKGVTLGAAWGALAWYARTDLRFVARASYLGSAAYVTLWLVWFIAAQ